MWYLMTVTENVHRALQKLSERIDSSLYEDILVIVQDGRVVEVKVTTKHKP